MKHIGVLLSSMLLMASCTNSQNGNIKATPIEVTPTLTPFHIYSDAFKEGESIPSIYTCDSSNITPQLHWNNPFKNTVSYALVMDDPDAPVGTWVHWVLYNIPASDTILNAHFPADTLAPNGAREGITSFGTAGYGGPCPPDGEHRYFFKIYALDFKVPYPAGLKKSQLLGVIKGHILAEANLMGRYKRVKK